MSLNIKKRMNKSKWVSYDGADFLIAPANNPKYSHEIAQGVKFGDYMKIANKKGGNIDDNDLLALSFNDLAVTEVKQKTSMALAKCVVLDWRNVVDDDNNEIAYDVELCYSFLQEDADFAEFVQTQADNIATADIVEKANKIKK